MYNVRIYDTLAKKTLSEFYVKEHLVPRVGDFVTVKNEKYEVVRRNLQIDNEIIILEVIHTNDLISG